MKVGNGRKKRAPRSWSAAALVAAAAWAGSAEARSVIRSPGDHPDYVVDMEFHFVVGTQSSRLNGRAGIGPGFRLSVPLMQNGFIPSINNNVAISAGFDWLSYGSFDNTGISDFVVPVVLQWNFWLSDAWSVFAEGGLAAEFRTQDSNILVPDFNGGGRFLFTEGMALVLRAGYPTATVGLAFLQ